MPRGVGGRQYYVTEDGTTQVSVLEVVEFVPPHRARVVDVSAWCQSWYEVTVDDTGDGHCSVTHEYWIAPRGSPGDLDPQRLQRRGQGPGRGKKRSSIHRHARHRSS